MNKDSKIYIAGHHGMVGSALWRNLEGKGYTNLIGRTYDQLDLIRQTDVEAFFEKEKPEYVFLAAAKVGGIVANNTYRAEFIYDNLMIQNNIIHQSYLSGVKKLLFLGSTCIYPKDCPQPMKEEYLLTGSLEYTNEPYAIAKIAGIKMCENYYKQYGCNFISVMPTNLYGPNDNYDLEKSHVLPALIRKFHLGKCLEDNNWEAIRNDLNKRPIEGISGENTEIEILKVLEKYGISSQKVPEPEKSKGHDSSTLRPFDPSDLSPVSVEIWGSGSPMREFLWSEEMADACVFIMENVDFSDILENSNLKEVRNTHINIGTGQEISINNLAYLLKETIGFNGELIFNTGKPDGTKRKLTDPSKLNELGWHHKIEITEGVLLNYNYYLKV